MSEASVVMKFVDEYSAKAKSIASANSGLSKSMEELSARARQQDARLSALNKQHAELSRSVRDAKAELKAAQKQFDSTGSSADSAALDAAHQKYDRLNSDLRQISRVARDAEKDLYNTSEQMRRLVMPSGAGTGRSTGVGSSGDGLLKELQKRGVLGTMGNAADHLLNSSLSESTANYIGGALSGAAQGFLTGGWAGAAVGLVTGVADAAIQEAQKHDQYFKSSVKEDYEGIQEYRENQVSGGSGIGSSRETLLLSYKTLMGGDQTAADELYNSLLEYANETPYTLGQLSDVGRTLLSYGYESSEIKDVINSIGSAAAATGSGAQGLSTMATVIGRLKAGEISAEQMNMLTNIGMNPYQTLADQYNSEKGTSITGTEMKKLISGGKVSAQWASDALLAQWGSSWGSAMQEFSQTFEGLQSTLDGLAENRQAFVGEQYNETRKPAMQDEINYLNSETGKMITEIEGYYGTVQARAENTQERFRREAEEALLYGKTYAELGDDVNSSLMILHNEYTAAKNNLALAESSGDTLAEDEARIAMYNALDAARKEAEAAWTKSDLFGVIQEGQMNLIGDLQTATYDSWFDYGYQIAEALSKGAAAAALNYNPSSLVYDPDTTYVLEDGKAVPVSQMRVETLDGGNAYGLHSVPYNGYIAELHQGERVLTAAEARAQDEGATGGSITVNIGDVTVRDPADADLLAEVIVERILEAKKTLVR